MKRIPRVLAIFLIVCLLAFTHGTASAAPDVLYQRLVADVSMFDPFTTGDLVVQMVHYQIYDSLFYELEDGTAVPNICTKYELTNDNKTMIFTIREGVKFHNGDIVTPEDVEFSLNTAIASPFTSKVTSMMDRAELLSDGRVALHLRYPFASLLGCLVNSSLSIVPKKIYEADPAGFAKNPVGSGPYTLGNIRPGETIEFIAFPDYWRGEAKIKRAVSRIIPDNTTALLALEAGDLHISQPSQDFSDRDAIKSNPNLIYYESVQPCFFMFGFNCEAEPFNNVTLRKAIAAAINKEELIVGAINGMGGWIEAAICTNLAQYPKDFKGIQYNPEEAKRLLVEAGYPNGLEFTCRVISATNYSIPAEIIQAQLRRIGVNMKVEAMERSSWMDLVYANTQHETTYYSHAISVNDADFCTYPYFHSSTANGKGPNIYNYKNPVMDDLLERARVTPDGDERNELYRKVAEIVRDDAVTVPTYMPYKVMAAAKEVKGMYADPMLRNYLYNYSW